MKTVIALTLGFLIVFPTLVVIWVLMARDPMDEDDEENYL